MGLTRLARRATTKNKLYYPLYVSRRHFGSRLFTDNGQDVFIQCASSIIEPPPSFTVLGGEIVSGKGCKSHGLPVVLYPLLYLPSQERVATRFNFSTGLVPAHFDQSEVSTVITQLEFAANSLARDANVVMEAKCRSPGRLDINYKALQICSPDSSYSVFLPINRFSNKSADAFFFPSDHLPAYPCHAAPCPISGLYYCDMMQWIATQNNPS
jgi:hypothetical protein